MDPISVETRQSLCQLAIECSLILDKQLNQLLDLYDFYTQRYPASTQSELFELADLQVSINALGELPHEIATWVSDLRNERPRVLSSIGFEINVLNEFALHMHSLASFMHRKGVDFGDFNPRQFGQVMLTLKTLNRRFPS